MTGINRVKTWVLIAALGGLFVGLGAAFGGRNGDRNPLVGLLAVILAPIAAGIIQMAISRSREYQADESGAYLSHDPDALADALQKIEAYANQTPPATMSPSQAHLFIMN